MKTDTVPRCFRLLVLSLLAFLSPACLGQTIAVRVVMEKNSRPLQKQPVTVSLFYDKSKGEHFPPDFKTHFRLETDANGEAQFEIPKPPPAHVSVTIQLTSLWHCCCWVLADTQDVVQKGIVASDRLYVGSDAPVKMHPGEIIFLTRPLAFWEWLLYPIMKE